MADGEPVRFPAIEIWNALVVACATALAILAPLELVLGSRANAFTRALGVITTFVLALDVVVRVRLLRREHDRMATAHVLPAWALTLDVIAAVPWTAVTGVGWLELLRISKLPRVNSILIEWRVRELRWADGLQLVFTLFWMALATHWITCGWMALRGVPAQQSAGQNYVDAVYWTVSTLSTVGYGDIVPADSAQKLYSVFTMVIGVAFFGYLVGFIAGLWARHDPARLRFKENIDRLATAAKYARLPRGLQRRIYDYHYYVWKQRLGYDEFDFLSNLPKNLRSEVSLHLKKHLLESGELFRGAHPDFLKEISLHLRPLVLTPGDVVFEQDDEGRDMYFIARGELEAVSRDGSRLSLMEPGHFFGEIALLTQAPRSATVRAVTYADVYSLSRSAFENVVSRYPDVLRQLEETARIRSATSAPRGEGA